MKLLHTSDWHLGTRLGGVDRTDDLFDRLAELCAVIDTQQVDCLLIAGDVFDEARSDRLTNLLRRLGGLLRSRVADGLTVIALAGNHDRPHLFPLLRSAAALLGGDSTISSPGGSGGGSGGAGPGGGSGGGRGQVAFVDTPGLVPVASRDGAELIQVACLPYPFADRYAVAAGSWPTREARHRELGDAVRRAAGELAADAERANPGVPMIMAAHLMARGATVGTGYYVSETDDVVLDTRDLPDTAYVALGHVHKPQTLGSELVRYSGSLERMDFGEADDDKAAVLVTLDQRKVLGVSCIPLAATAFARVEAADVDELVAAHAAMRHPDQTLVSLVVHDAGTTRIGALLAQARRLFPRLYGQVQIVRPPRPRAPAGTLDRADVAGTVRTYLARALAGDPDAAALQDLATQILTEAGVVHAVVHAVAAAVDLPAVSHPGADSRGDPTGGTATSAPEGTGPADTDTEGEEATA